MCCVQREAWQVTVGHRVGCHLCFGVHPGLPAMLMAEMPIFVFTSLPRSEIASRECIVLFKKEHSLSSMYVPGTAGDTETNEPASPQ